MFDSARGAVDELLTDPGLVRDRLRRGFGQHVAAARRNPELLSAFLHDHGWGAPAWAA
jgi:hypothetical protein